jgi:hypothetical protein
MGRDPIRVRKRLRCLNPIDFVGPVSWHYVVGWLNEKVWKGMKRCEKEEAARCFMQVRIGQVTCGAKEKKSHGN